MDLDRGATPRRAAGGRLQGAGLRLPLRRQRLQQHPRAARAPTTPPTPAPRGALALPGVAPADHAASAATAGDWGLHPPLAGLQALFEQERLALVAQRRPAGRAGDAGASTSRAARRCRRSSSRTATRRCTGRPRSPTSRRATGWGGRVADLLHSLNGTPQVSMSISLAGTNTFQVGRDVVTQYQVVAEGHASASTATTSSDRWHRAAVARDPAAARAQLRQPLRARPTATSLQRALDSDRAAARRAREPPPARRRCSRTPSWAGSSG